ncbi:MAG: SpoIIE family protein phosphatase [Candidatus Aquicultorales bacterium]
MEQPASDRRLQRVLAETVDEAIIVLNRAGRITYANHHTERMLGLPLAHLLKRPFREQGIVFRSKEGAEVPYEDLPFADIFQDAKPATHRTFILENPERILPVAINVSPLTDGKGRVVAVLIAIADMTERERAEKALKSAHRGLEQRIAQRTAELLRSNALLKKEISIRERAEKALRESEALFRATFESAAIGIALADLQGRIMDTNQTFQKMLGYSQAELSALRIDSITYRDDVAIDMENFIELVGGIRDSFQIEKRYVRKDGGIIWGMLSVSLVRDDMGMPKFAIGMVEDITERKRSEDALKKYQLLSEHAKDIVLFIRPSDGRILEANKAAVETYGYFKDELLSKTVYDFRVGDAPLVKDQMREADETGIQFETMHKRKDGTVFPVEVSSRGAVIGEDHVLMSIVRDISARKQTQELSDALNRINAIINSTLELDEIMRRVVVEVTKAAGCEAAMVNMRVDDHWVTRHAYGFPPDIIGLTIPKAIVSSLFQRFEQSFVCDDAYRDPRFDEMLAKKYAIRSAVGVPLVVKEKVEGCLYCAYRSAAIPFTDEQKDFIEKVAASVSLAVENASLYAAERNIADTLQHAILTLPQTLPGVEFGHLYRSATEAAEVGGDFYDLFELDEGRMGIVIGDVSGKGLEAATMTSLVKNTIKAYAYESPRPELIVSKTNDVLVRSSPFDIFVTLFVGILETRTGRLEYCNAGHPRPLIKRPSAVAILDESNSVTGAFPGLSFKPGIERLTADDVLVLYTDGVLEARKANDFFGERRLVAVVNNAEGPPGALPGSIFDALIEFTGGHLTDDTAILAISPILH